MQENRYTKLLKNFGVVFCGSMGSKLLNFIMVPFYTRVMSPEEFGTVDLALVYVVLGSVCFSLCLSSSVFVFPHGETQSKQHLIFSSGFFCGLISISSFVVAVYIFKLLFEHQYHGIVLFRYFHSIVFLIYANFIYDFLQCYLRGVNHMLEYSIAGLIYSCTFAGAGFLFVPFYKVDGFFYSQFCAAGFACMYMVFLTHEHFFDKHSFSLDFPLLKKMIAFSIPMIPNAFLWWILTALNRFLLKNAGSLHALGEFAAANKLPSIVSVCASIFSLAWQVSVLDEIATDSYKKFYNTTFHVTFVFMGGVSLVLSFISCSLTKIFLGQAFQDAWKYIPMLGVAVFCTSMSSIVAANFSAMKKSSYLLYSAMITLAGFIVCSFILVPRFLILGAVISTLIGSLLLLLSRLFLLEKFYPLEGKYKYVFVFMLMLTASFLIPLFPRLVYFFVPLYALAFFVLNKNILLQIFKLIKKHTESFFYVQS